MKKYILNIIAVNVLILSLSIPITGTTYYVSVTGNDLNPGTLAAPWRTFQKALTMVYPGDIVYFRGGIYTMANSSGIDFSASNSGNSTNPISYLNYPGETPIFDYASATPEISNPMGMTVAGVSYIVLKGFEIRNVVATTSGGLAYGIYVEGSNINFENITVRNIDGVGYRLNGNDLFFSNCDAISCFDSHSSDPGSMGDGWKVESSGVDYFASFTGCRAIYCSASGWNCSSNDGVVTWDYCWAFRNGKNAGGVHYSSASDGNGFRLGSNTGAASGKMQRLLTRCIAADNYGMGFTENNSGFPQIKMGIYNCVAYNNAFGFVNYVTSEVLQQATYRNNIAYSNIRNTEWNDASKLIDDHNTWNTGAPIVNDVDFISLVTTQLYSLSRKPDGSLPDVTFMNLAAGSDLIDAGINVGLPYLAAAPDLGWIEYMGSTDIIPVYVNSVIENSTPRRLDIIYNLTLADIVPATSAFTVTVNSVVRPLTLVYISGHIVQLALSSPVANGDIVTVSYTKPGTNPLQTASGAQAASFTDRSVTNNVALPAVIPTVTTTLITDITSATANTGGTVTSDGGAPVTRRGVCWSTSQNPTVTNDTTWNGSGTGTFTSTLWGLEPNVTYYVRAYAINSIGIAYGNELSFKTTYDIVSDSLALVTLYNSTNGPEWTNNNNWLITPVNMWYGITVSGNRVTAINLNKNNLTGIIPSSIGDLTSLVRLDLWTNSLQGTIPPEIGTLTNLTRLYLNNNSLNGDIPSTIGNLVNLDILYLNGNELEGSIPIEIASLTNLTILSLGSNQLEGSIPTQIGNLTNLKQLSLYDCMLSGPIPHEIGNLSSLEYLLLRGNQLSGSIPDEIWNLPGLKQLHVGINDLSGLIPSNIGNLNNLQFLMLYSNHFSGSLPNTIANLSGLKILNINNNDFSGPIPDELSNLDSLWYINISDNNFSRLPDLSSFTNLDSLFIQNNQFTFRDIEPNIGVAKSSFLYSPQANIAVDKDSTLYLGSEMYLMVSAGGKNSRFLWYKDGSPLGGLSTDSILTINPVNLSDAGVYTCEATNILAPDLTLATDPATLKVINAVLVSNTNNSGQGSLRHAIDYANDNVGRDSIVFNIPVGPLTIQPITPLPAINDPVIIDGYTQPGAEVSTGGTPATLVIEIDGTNAGTGALIHGLNIKSSNCIIRGLTINRFAGSGIYIDNMGNSNAIEGNYIGTDITGDTSFGNNLGVQIDGSNNNIGGTEPRFRNIISGNNSGILLGITATGNYIKGNYIGTNKAGNNKLQNQQAGVAIEGASSNYIGIAEPGGGNLISGNSLWGIHINNYSENPLSCTKNLILGNIIGLKANGIEALGNSNGITIENSSDNVIGGAGQGEGNIISGSTTDHGIWITGALSKGNKILGNMIGTNANGDAAVGNAGNGIVIDNGASKDTIGGIRPGEGNLISGNKGFAINIYGEEVKDNQIINNLIGTNAAGTALISNGDDGVNITESSGNFISGNVLCGAGRGGVGNNGIEILGSSATGNIIAGNFIGTNSTSTAGLGNGFNGIQIKRNAHENTIGPDNVISGNFGHGILIESDSGWPGATSADKNVITGNLIGTNTNGTAELSNHGSGVMIQDNASQNTIGPDNVISGNNSMGIHIYGTGSSENIIIGNLIGTKANGMEGLGNHQMGIWMNASNNIIGGIIPDERNVISANYTDGIEVGSNYETGNKIQGNYIGTDITGNGSLLNGGADLRLNNSSFSIVGGLEPGERNVIGSMAIVNEGAHDNQVIGNYIGLNKDGTGPINSEFVRAGILISDASDNVIGPGNVISGVEEGIYITEYFGIPEVITTNNRIIGNFIGTNADCTDKVPNNIGIHIEDVHGITVGGPNESDRNIISGNGTGINLEKVNTNKNFILGNYIGVDKSGQIPIPNHTGINIGPDAKENFVGGSTNGAGNLVAFNTIGIWLGSDSAYVKGNEIHSSIQDGIFIDGSHNIIGGSEYGSRNYFHGNNNGIRTGFKANYNLIEGNYLGTDRKGETDMTDGWNGVALSGSYNQVKNNLISGYNNGHGIYIQRWYMDKPIPEGNRLEGNIIGMNASGSAAIPNQVGISLNTAIGTVISKNMIAGNQYDGIHISGQFFTEEDEYQYSTGNMISQNSVYNNGQMGIDLDLNFVTENDSIYNEATGKWDYDFDLGSNNLQNFPVIDSISFDLSNRTIFAGGTLESTPASEFTLEFFVSKVTDALGYGEGQTYLGSVMVTTDADGKAPFAEKFTAYSSWGDVITATATDAEGNTSEFSMAVGGLKSQILAEMNIPFHYKINKDGHPNILDGSDLDAITNSFKTWTDVTTSDIEFIEDGTTTDKYASATDGVNLVSFVDDRFPFSPGVLAMAAKTLKIEPGDQTAKIIDADIVFNPAYLNHPDIKLGIGEGVFDIQSIATHEIGHVMGLIHSGIVSSTMFFMLDKGTAVRDLEQDDESWVSYRYQEPDYDTIFGSISGNIKYGYNTQPVAGALVIAKNITTLESVHAYSDADGSYLVPGLAPGTYSIHIEPLDGDVDGTKLKPGNISVYIYSNTIYTDYPEEYLSINESSEETDDIPVNILVAAGDLTAVSDIITNLDNTHPTVESVTPNGDNVDVTQIFKIIFSEVIDGETLTDETCFLSSGEDGGIITTGSFKSLSDEPLAVLFVPDESLEYLTEYTLHITKGITDLKANSLDVGTEDEYICTFKTVEGDTEDPVLKDIIPAGGTENVFVATDIKMFFSEPMKKTSVENGFTLSWLDNVSGLQVVQGGFRWDNDNMQATFVPLASLREGTEYTISLSGTVTDLSGNLLQGQEFLFETVPQANPVITYLGPEDLQKNVALNTPVVVDFSEPVNPVSINSETFKLMLGSNQVAGSFEFLNANSRVVFRPYSDLGFIQTYSVILSGEIEDVSDPVLRMVDDTSITFTTTDIFSSPHVEFLDPMSGITGALVTITGTGFDPDPDKNIAVFNGITSPVIKASLTSVVTKVPVGAISGPVSVSAGGVASDDSKYFYVIPVSPDPCDDVIANVSTGTKSRDVDVDADAGLAYVTNPDAGTVSVVDLKLLTELYEIEVGKEPSKIDINPQSTRAYVTNYSSHDVSVIDLTKKPNTVIQTIKVGINPYGVVVTPDGKRVYVANYSSNDLSVIDADPFSGGFDCVVSNVSTGTKNRDVDVTADAGLILVAGDDGLKIVCSDPEDLRYNTVIASASSGTRTRDVDVAGDAGLAFVTTEEGSILVIDICPVSDYFGAAIANVSSSSKAREVEVSGDAMFVYVTNTDENSVSVYQMSTGGTGTYNTSIYSNLELKLYNTIFLDGDSPIGLAIDGFNKQLYVANSGESSGTSSVEIIRICCGPVPPPTSIGELIITVQTMINHGIVKEAIGNDLIKYLNSALDNLAKDKTKSAINNLNTFIVKVKDLVKSRQITSEQGQPLIDAANAIIAMLKEKTKSETIELGNISLSQFEPNIDYITETRISKIYPNPFSSSVTLEFEIAGNDDGYARVMIRIYDYNGTVVSTIADNMMPSGRYSMVWKGVNQAGGHVPGGTYFIQLRTDSSEIIRAVVLIR